ncbi:MAG: hypothetical protein Q9O24_11585 [Gammaproteobacteria bacterium]|nr:hypothetical protein [Gammaproteobacteria bacterium]
MMIALPDEEWGVFKNMSLTQFVDVFLKLTEKINLLKFRKSRRGIKKPPVKRNKYPNQPHVSTAKLLRGEKPNE